MSIVLRTLERLRKAHKVLFDKMMRAAKDGPQMEVRYKTHDWIIKKYNKSTFGSRTTVNGEISHVLAGRPDDQVLYVISLNAGGITSINVNIKNRGLAPIIAPIAAALGTYLTGVPIPKDAVEAVASRVGKAVEGDEWESVAHLLVSNIAIRV